MIVPILIAVVYLSVLGYFVWLATRLVSAVERIARSLDDWAPPDARKPS